MKRVVQRRPQQLGHPGIDHDEVARGVARFDVDDARHQRAGRSGNRPSRLDDNRQSGAAHFAEQRGRIGVRRRDVAAVVRDAEPAAEIEILEVDPEALDLRG